MVYVVVIVVVDENLLEEVMFLVIFVFGDLLVDNGNNNCLNLFVRFNYLLYGIDFDGG